MDLAILRSYRQYRAMLRSYRQYRANCVWVSSETWRNEAKHRSGRSNWMSSSFLLAPSTSLLSSLIDSYRPYATKMVPLSWFSFSPLRMRVEWWEGGNSFCFCCFTLGFGKSCSCQLSHKLCFNFSFSFQPFFIFIFSFLVLCFV